MFVVLYGPYKFVFIPIKSSFSNGNFTGKDLSGPATGRTTMQNLLRKKVVGLADAKTFIFALQAGP